MVFMVTSSSFIGMTLYAICAGKDVGVRGSIIAAAITGGLALGTVLTQFQNSSAIYLTVTSLFVFISFTFVAIDT